MQKRIESALDKYFGFTSFRNGQDEIIKSIISGNDTLAVMPTGGGKSLCYQLPAVLTEGTAIVISPLIALMKDQVDSLLLRDYPATLINSSLSYQEIFSRMEQVRRGVIKLLYIAPERLESRSFLSLLNDFNISFVAVDEAHCISEWGHDFRPSYLRINDLFNYIKRVPVIALTATATPEVQKDILKSLSMERAASYIRGFDRPNLNYKTIEASNKSEMVINILRTSAEGSSIIYAGSRKRVDMFNDEIRNAGIKSYRYHAGLSELERKQQQENFINNEKSVIVATNAFGMGIDKSNVRNVIHIDYTSTLEAYYQEAGRAGRDGSPADCILIYEPKDYFLQEFFIKASHPEKGDIIKLYNSLFDALSIGEGSGYNQAVYLSDAELANRSGLPFITTQNILKLLEKNRLIVRGSTKGAARIKLMQSRDFIFEYYETLQENRKPFLEALLRSVGSEAFREFAELNITSMIAKHNLNKTDFSKALKQYMVDGIIQYQAPKTGAGITLLSERTSTESIPIDFLKIETRREQAYRKLEMVKRYASTGECKRNYILKYFGEFNTKDTCGRCSSCLSPVKSSTFSEKDMFLLDEIVKSVAALGERFGKIMIADFIKGKRTKRIVDRKLFNVDGFGNCREFPESQIVSSVNSALAEGFLSQTVDMYPVLKLTLKGRQKAKTKQKYFDSSKSTGDLNIKDLYDKLSSAREKLASNIGIQPRGIISDKTLRSIGRIQPRTIDAMSDISGISENFISNFGSIFLDVIIDEIEAEKTEKLAAKQQKSPREHLVIKMIKDNESLTRIASSIDMTAADTAKMIQDMLESRCKLDLHYLFDDRIYLQICSYLSKYPSAMLKDVKAGLNLKISLPLLRVMIAKARIDNSN